MKLNDAPFMLLSVFDKALNKKLPIEYNSFYSSAPVFLYQDAELEEYAEIISRMFVKQNKTDNLETLLNWQLLQSYRIVNTILASVLVDDTVKKALLPVKEQFEQTAFLAGLLKKIHCKELLPKVVCSGHGFWPQKNGFVDLKKTDASVMVISGLGGALSDFLATELENDLFEPQEVVVVSKLDKTKPIETINSTPTFFNKYHRSQVPNFCLVDAKDVFPKPRVIEPLTGKVLLDLKPAKTDSEVRFLPLAQVVDKFNDRRIAWSACTKGINEQGKPVGKFVNYLWASKEEVEKNKKKQRIEESSSSAASQSDTTQFNN